MEIELKKHVKCFTTPFNFFFLTLDVKLFLLMYVLWKKKGTNIMEQKGFIQATIRNKEYMTKQLPDLHLFAFGMLVQKYNFSTSFSPFY